MREEPMLFSFYFIGDKHLLTLIDPHLLSACLKSILSSTLCILTALLFVTPSHAASWEKEFPQAQLIGSGEFRWFGLSIYSAKLWSAQKPFDINAAFALELTYHRKISRQQLVKTSMDEIKRLSNGRYPSDKLQHWETELSDAFTDVSNGDKLIGVFLPGRGCYFYNQKSLLAEIPDQELAQAFFGIWLDKRSKDSELRTQLLGRP